MGVLSSRSRKLGFVVACVVSVLIGVALVFFLVQPRRVELVRTTELYAVLAMLVLPGFTAWANRRVRRDFVPTHTAPPPAIPSTPPTPPPAAPPSAAHTPRPAAHPTPAPRTHAPGRASPPDPHHLPAARSKPDVVVIPAELLRPYYRNPSRTNRR